MNTAAISEQEVRGLALAGSIIIITLVIIAAIAYILSALGYWKMFKKAGIPGWKAFVPFLNLYEMFRISWIEKKFWFFFLASAVSVLLLYFSELLAGGTSLAFLPDLLGIAAAVVAVDFLLKMNIFLARAYGKSRVFGACLWAFPFISSLVLGFGKAAYIGNQSEEQ